MSNTELFDWSCQSCGAFLGKYPSSEFMECVNLECSSCGQDHSATGVESRAVAKQAVEVLKTLGYEWSFESLEYVKVGDEQ